MPLNRRLPKRGFNHADRHETAEINVDSLEKHFEDGAEVTAEALVSKGLSGEKKGGVKVLGRGELTKKLSLKVTAISAGAQAKVEAAGGSVELIEAPVARAVKNRTKGKAAGKK